MLFLRACCCLFLVWASSVYALTPQEALAMAQGEGSARVQAVQAAVAKADAATLAFIQALADDAVKIADGKPYIFQGDKALDPISGAPVALSVEVLSAAQDVVNNNRMRGELDNALAALKLLSPDPTLRRAAAKNLQGQVGEAQLPLLERALAQETESDVAQALGQLRAVAMLASPDEARRVEAARLLEPSGARIVFAGEGPRLEELCRTVEALPHVSVIPPRPAEELAAFLGAADLHLVSIRPDLAGLLVPSKIYGILAAGRPVLHVGPDEAEAARLLSESGAGLSFQSGDATGLARTVRELISDHARRARLGENARRAAEDFTFTKALARWRDVLHHK
jgi:hypothetical protein